VKNVYIISFLNSLPGMQFPAGSLFVQAGTVSVKTTIPSDRITTQKLQHKISR
jgi:hypothetical protein